MLLLPMTLRLAPDATLSLGALLPYVQFKCYSHSVQFLAIGQDFWNGRGAAVQKGVEMADLAAVVAAIAGRMAPA